MWWSRKGRKAAKPYAETLEERMEVLEAAQRTLKAEWLDTYDKLYRLAGRLDAGRRWATEKPPSPPITEQPIVPDNGSEGVIQAPTESPPAAIAKMSRSELLRSLTGR